ncbi:MAG: response regulator transcription factor [Anaerolineales bacterium]|jgi:DNA-binding NarL/FixJ family response regulator
MNRWIDLLGDESIRILILGPDSLARASLEKAIADMQGLHVAGVADLDDDLEAAIKAFQPEVIVAEVDWEAASSSQGQQRLSELEIPLLLLSDPELDLRGIGDGWLARDSRPAQIRAAIQAIACELVVYDKNVLDDSETRQSRSNDSLVDPLTERELEVLQLMAEGQTNRSIAFQLGISEYTVKFHVNAILKKLDAQSRTEASIKAARLGVIML